MTSYARWIPVLTYTWAAAILIVSVIPSEELPSLHIWEPDKVFHAIFYAIFTLLVYLQFTLTGQKAPGLKFVIKAALLCILYGFCIEMIQRWLPTRSFDLFDVLADCVGCMLTVAGVLVFSNRKSGKSA